MVECPNCGCDYTRLGSHWRSCGYPELSNKKHEILTGILMGDGSVHIRENKTPAIQIRMTCKPYLDYLDEIFGVYSTGLSLVESAEAASNRLGGNMENYSDQYLLRLRASSEFERYESWYQSGSKVFPDEIDLTPTVLKHWYVGDGTLGGYNGRRPRMRISAPNEEANVEKIRQYFVRAGLPEPTFSHQENDFEIRYGSEDTPLFFDYVGDAPPGFEYKWPDYRDQQT